MTLPVSATRDALFPQRCKFSLSGLTSLLAQADLLLIQVSHCILVTDVERSIIILVQHYQDHDKRVH